MKRRTIIISLSATLGALALGWYLFGWSTEGPPGMRITAKRYFGRITLFEIDRNGDGVPDARAEYSWSHPYVHHTLPQRNVLDNNFDGIWDTWIIMIAENLHEFPLCRYEVDTDLDGLPDVEFIESDPYAGNERLRSLRGF
ncbi:MAG: hypothetical protein GY847_24415 [Proteobacteria bacterium]|nr:hypothetical protein [Pseudomonadota bacterium]